MTPKKTPKQQTPKFMIGCACDEDRAKRFDEFCRKNMVSRSNMLRLGMDLVLELKELPGLGVKR